MGTAGVNLAFPLIELVLNLRLGGETRPSFRDRESLRRRSPHNCCSLVAIGAELLPCRAVFPVAQLDFGGEICCFAAALSDCLC